MCIEHRMRGNKHTVQPIDIAAVLKKLFFSSFYVEMSIKMFETQCILCDASNFDDCQMKLIAFSAPKNGVPVFPSKIPITLSFSHSSV